MLSTQVEGLSKKLDTLKPPGLLEEERIRMRRPNNLVLADVAMRNLVQLFYAYAHGKDFRVAGVSWASPNFDAIIVDIDGKLDEKSAADMRKIASDREMNVEFRISTPLTF